MNYNKILLQVKKKPRVHGYISPDTETRLSPIHGLGLFAKINIVKGKTVVVWGGFIKTKEEIKKLSKDIGFEYALEIYPGFYIAEGNKKELDSSDFVNHSCVANCKIINKLVMITKRNIKKGEELTSDFSNKSNKGMSFNCNCNCGNKSCKKVVYFD